MILFFFADRDYRSYPFGIDSIEVSPVAELVTKEFDVVVVTPTFYFKEIMSSLMSEGIPLKKNRVVKHGHFSVRKRNEKDRNRYSSLL